NLVKNSPLHVACKEGYVRSARILLEEGGASTDACGEYGLNALAFALYTNNGRLVRCLFRQEASIGGALSSDFQPINMAIRNGNLRMLELLLRRGVDVNSAPLCFINAFCQTALHVCVERDQVEMARDLIRAGAQINAKNRTGATPLHLAVQRGNVRLVQLLLDHKCSIDELNYNGETPLIRAVVSNNLPLVRILLNNGASIERLRNSEPPVLLYLVQENHEEVLDYLLEHYQQFDANEQDAYGNTLLYVATQHNHINIVKLLVGKYGARANPTNHKQLTPLMIARVKAYKEIFHFLEARLVEE
ncbi:AGAP009521-PA, partial [Anopheles gambiae str. PEST]